MKISMPQPLSALTLQANQLNKIPETKGVSDDAKLREAANDFEAIFIQQMLKTMRKTSFESDLLPKSEGEKVFQSLLDEQYALLSAKSGSLGLSEMIYQQLKPKVDKK
ncbi:MAG: rod-binding protein [SAR324 cluster bacterium]|jgi:flagellar protein FlgJ|nr:rod-binding protein [SAR324 cluster bacterium]